MNTTSNGYVLGFAVVVCVVMSTALALTANGLKATQEAAAEFDRQKNVMAVAGLIEPGDRRSMAELQRLYKERIEEQVLDVQTGEIDKSRTAADVARMKSAADKARYRAIAIARDDKGQPNGFVLPIKCRGLWGEMFGYLALESDAMTVRGITFYQHKETPGLGGEVDNEGWKQSWRGKSVLDEQGRLIGVTVKKGKVDPGIAHEKLHAVDGLSGATITSNGVTKGLATELQAYQRYLSKFWARRN
jgi:Na+-transporting NADH:ubiquinone oxidoreductase subunit C